jgi:ankyrin repeat protein
MPCDLANPTGSTPLHLSAQEGYLEATKALVKTGAALNGRDEFGDTLLLLASNPGNLFIFSDMVAATNLGAGQVQGIHTMFDYYVL